MRKQPPAPDVPNAPVPAARAAGESSSAEAQATLAAIVASSDDAIVGKNLDGIIMTWNAAAERLFGYRADEIVGRSVLTLLPPERHAEETTILATLRRGERIEHFETERVRKDGRRIEVSLSVSPIKDATGRIIGAAKIARDIGTRRALERERDELLARERQARADAEAASRAKDAFLATVSHELRTPLSPILTWTHMLREGFLDPARSTRALETIERSARSLTQLIDDLMDVSRIVTGKMRMTTRPVDLAAVVRAAIEVVRPAADAKAIRIDTALDTGADAFVGDPERLQQVAWNLLSNAIKFTPEHGSVQVRLSHVDSHVELEVADTGQGFDPSFREHMFESFRQADCTATRRHGGLGLGLAIVRHIVELHGGTVRADSPGEGRGATFRVRLPYGLQAPSGEEEATAAAAPFAGRGALPLAGVRVLVVDDEPDANEAVSTVLAAAGGEVRVEATVASALTLLERWRPDVVVTDIAMPGEDGYALRAAMQRNPAWRHIPAIALTAYASRDDRVRLLGAGFQLHIAKPVDPPELLAGVANVASLVRKS